MNESGELVRHHQGSLWITCRVRYRDWQHPLDQPRTWTPLFFLDDAVALAAGHRPCGLCRREAYLDYRSAVTGAVGAQTPVLAGELNRMLAAERLRRGRGLVRAPNRIPWNASLDELPTGTVVIDSADGAPYLVTEGHLQPFTFAGWGSPIEMPRQLTIGVLTPPTSVAALANGFIPRLHATAFGEAS